MPPTNLTGTSKRAPAAGRSVEPPRHAECRYRRRSGEKRRTSHAPTSAAAAQAATTITKPGTGAVWARNDLIAQPVSRIQRQPERGPDDARSSARDQRQEGKRRKPARLIRVGRGSRFVHFSGPPFDLGVALHLRTDLRSRADPDSPSASKSITRQGSSAFAGPTCGGRTINPSARAITLTSEESGAAAVFPPGRRRRHVRARSARNPGAGRSPSCRRRGEPAASGRRPVGLAAQGHQQRPQEQDRADRRGGWVSRQAENDQVAEAPTHQGLAGRMAIFQKPSFMPAATSAFWTRSWSPTENGARESISTSTSAWPPRGSRRRALSYRRGHAEIDRDAAAGFDDPTYGAIRRCSPGRYGHVLLPDLTAVSEFRKLYGVTRYPSGRSY